MHTKRFSNYNQKGTLFHTNLQNPKIHGQQPKRIPLFHTNLQNPKNVKYMDTILNLANLVWF